MELPIEFKCPLCGSTETVAQLAAAPFKASGKIDKDAPVHARMDAAPLIQPTLAVASVPTLVRHFDTCAICGIEYCTRAEMVDAPIQFQPPPKGFRGFGNLPFGKG